jgi:cytochrome c peroxidase
MRALANLRKHLRAALLGVLLGAFILAVLSSGGTAPAAIAPERLAALKRSFARPSFVPAPPDNPGTPAKIALGARLFSDTALSATGSIACASCHDPQLSYSDGVPRGRGVTARRLERRTPSLWNIAFSPLLFWDGRASSLESQVHFPIEHPDEMGSSIAAAVLRLDAGYASAFAAAFPDDPRITQRNLERALAAFERSLVSPPTRFDRWVAGDDAALSVAEVNGFAIFTGKGRCSNCHSGFAFTDHGFYDIGLPGEDRGRGPIIGLKAADHAFKTPSLRERAWTAPYMHDGSLPTLEDVVRNYESGGVQRATRSGDLPAKLALADAERGELVEFLQTLSSEAPPRPSREAWLGDPPRTALPSTPTATTLVRQVDKQFHPARVRLKAGQTLTISNADQRVHNVRIYAPTLDFNSGAQEAGDVVSIPFANSGSFDAFCGIHPAMRLRIDVE